MHIVFFLKRYWPAVGGVEKYIAELSRSLCGLGHRITIVSGAHCAGLAERESVDGIEIVRFPAYRSSIRCRLRLMQLRRLILCADVIHISDVLMVEYFQTMIGWTLPNRPLFMTRHGLSYKCPVPAREKRRAARAARWVHGTIDDGHFIAKWLGVGSDVSLNQGLSPKASSLNHVAPQNSDRATFVGRLDWDTGITLYVEAIDALRNRHGVNMSLDIYGGGELEKALRDKVDASGASIRFHGFVPNAQDRIVDGDWAFLGGRLAIQEAMARRRPVVAAYVNSLKKDYVSNEPFSKFILTAGTADEIVRHVLRLRSNAAERETLVARAFDYARTLTWDRTAQGYLELWRKCSPVPNVSTSWLYRLLEAIRLAKELA